MLFYKGLPIRLYMNKLIHQLRLTQDLAQKISGKSIPEDTFFGLVIINEKRIYSDMVRLAEYNN